MPFRELVFDGVPHREAAKMLPTVNCLVELQQVSAPRCFPVQGVDAMHTCTRSFVTQQSQDAAESQVPACTAASQYLPACAGLGGLRVPTGRRRTSRTLCTAKLHQQAIALAAVQMPFTVITLAEVAVVSLERVGFNLRNFDMALVFKDLSRDVVRVDAIPMASLDTLRVRTLILHLVPVERDKLDLWQVA